MTDHRTVKGLWLGIATLTCVLCLPCSTSLGATIGSTLTAPPNEFMCGFESLEPKSRVCTVGQESLFGGHKAPDGLTVPFDGIAVGWSIVSGTAPPGTGSVKLALRAMSGPGVMGKGSEVELPLGAASGARHTFQERMPVSAGQQIGLRIEVSNLSTQEASAPIGFSESGVGVVDVWQGEPWESIWDQEENSELLLSVEVEPDEDKDGYGDLTQDCFPHHPGDQELCGADFVAPTIQPTYAKRQAFLRTGAVVVRVASNEAGMARAIGQLEIKGRRSRSYALRRVRKPISAGSTALLRAPLGKTALKAARLAAREGKKFIVRLRVDVVDSASNASEAVALIRPQRSRR